MTIAVGLAGLGAIGGVVASRLDEGLPGMRLAAVCSRRRDLAERRCASFRHPPAVVEPEGLARTCDIIVECAPAPVFRGIATPVLEAGRTLLTVSGAALLDNFDLVQLAQDRGGKIILASGALLGLDGIRAAAEGTIQSVEMETRKPPQSLKAARYVLERGIDLDELTEPLRLFAGSARQAAREFPANANVMAALGLAGIGPDRTYVEIWADPAKTRNCHRVTVGADCARMTLEIHNIPDPENPGTSRIAALSVIAALKGLASPLHVGS